MHVIRDKETKIVQYLFYQEPVITGYLTEPVRALDIIPETHEAIEVPAPPEYWHGNLWRYDNGWEIADNDLYAERLNIEKQSKLGELTAKAKDYLSNAMGDYSEWEAVIWPLLIAEAEQFQVDGTVGEYMSAEIGGAYQTAGELAGVLLQRKESMKQLRAGVILNRQQKEQEINAAGSFTELDLVETNGGWPT